MKLNIISISHPGACFNSKVTLDEFKYEATRYENIVAAYAADGDDCCLNEELRKVGFTDQEILWHAANRGKRMRCGFVKNQIEECHD